MLHRDKYWIITYSILRFPCPSLDRLTPKLGRSQDPWRETVDLLQ
jgi:hypothetical protein